MRLMLRMTVILAAAMCIAGVARGADSTTTKVTLIDAGQGDKSELRYDIPQGTAQTSRMSTKMSMKQSMGGMQMPAQPLPEMVAPLTGTVVERLGDDARYEVENGEMEVIDDGTIPPQMLQAMRQAMASSGGTVTKGIVNGRGEHRDIEIVLPNGVNPMMADQMKQGAESAQRMALPLPEEAVGVGAKWLVEQVVEMNGLKMTQAATCTLKERTGDVVLIEMDMVQSADPQKIVNPQAPQMDINLKSLDGKGGGTMKIDLSRMFPIESKLKMTVSMQMTMDMMGQKQDLDQEMSMTMNMESEDAPVKATP